ncbi:MULTISPECIES: hypothetical protein [Bacillus]|uniref:hypothetical protein n=1 Tax=Bacillus TaxID=1386 RepID=UPI0003309F82|nr:hypothetical protein [Bacillus wiedmannii]EOP05494.1 hypothetical protein ICS_04842 [Bacillus cereus BAG2O-3]MBJ8118729.1 hypothetical protein [Bacillus cereus]PFW77785.1 hypothetical protein COL27_25010 [Bacillus sp. AFS075960]RFB11619.1 hypothetical protein DZB88_17580 [Bacillus sp. OE]RFB28124.1 hypothetical protein DZB85_08010 [Bacillus sp. LB(2018)]RFB48138.1 hypothetical protein DZB83_06660 [Bacillus sp. dmp10]RFB71364.1 hypothetical protein DZB94_21235 [Bacillus sp. AW]HDR8169552.
MKGEVFSITTLVLLATSISTSAFYPTLSGHKSGNLLSKKSYKKPVIKYIPTLILFILASISSVMFVLNNGMGELMIAVSLGIATIVNGLLLLTLKVVRVIVARGK